MHPQLFEIIQIFVQSGVSHISVVTNATLISENILENLSDACLLDKLTFQVSLDGATSSQHDYLRGFGAFRNLEKGLNILKKYNLPYFFHCVIHKGNYLYIDEIIEYANKVHETRVDFSLLKKKGRGIENFDDIALDVKDQIDIIKHLKLKKETHDINVPTVFYGSCPIFSDEKSETFIRIDAQGNVYPCQNFNYVGSSLGNIIEESLEDICNNNRMQIIKNNIEGFRSLYSKCHTCALFSYCKKGCPGVEYCDELKSEISNECLLRKEFFKRLLIESEVIKYVHAQ